MVCGHTWQENDQILRIFSVIAFIGTWDVDWRLIVPEMESSDYSKGERGELHLQPSSYDSRRTTGTGEDRDTCAMRLL